MGEMRHAARGRTDPRGRDGDGDGEGDGDGDGDGGGARRGDERTSFCLHLVVPERDDT